METSKEIKIAGYILSILFIGFILFVIISSFLFNSSGNETVLTDYVVGKSMEPALHDGDYVSYDTTRLSPAIGEIVAFECFTEKCINGNSSIGKLKRLTQIDYRNCYWFEGDNKSVSWDSRAYGWLCPSDIRIIGTVISFIPKGYSESQNVKQPTTEIKSISTSPDPIKSVTLETAVEYQEVEVEEETPDTTDWAKYYADQRAENDRIYAEAEAKRKQEASRAKIISQYKSSHPNDICLFDDYGYAYSCTTLHKIPEVHRESLLYK